jgi:hypothetical protein
MSEKVINEIDGNDGNGPVVLENQKIAALAQDTIDNLGDKDISNDFGKVDPCLYQKISVAELISKLNITERCKSLGQAYLLFESVEQQLRHKMSTGNTQTNGLIEQMKLVIGFLKHANDFCYTVEDFTKEMPVVKEEYQNLIDDKIVEERYDPYNLSENDFWVEEAKIESFDTNKFAELKEKEICRGCYNVYHCKSRNALIRKELQKRKQYPDRLFDCVWHVITKCDEFKIDGDGDGGNIPLPMIPDRP